MFTSIRRSAIALGAALALIAVVLLLAHAGGVSPAPRTALAGAPSTPVPTPDNCLGCKMSLEIEGTLGASAVSCDSKTGTFQNPTKCTLEEGTGFVVKIVANTIPLAGYIGWETFLTYGGLDYKPTTERGDEIVWPESSLPVRNNGVLCSPSPCPQPVGDEGRVAHADLSAFVAPFPTSTHVGPLVELQMNCGVQGNERIALLPRFGSGGSGPLFSAPVGAYYVIHAFSSGIGPLGTVGVLPLDIDNDGQLDREQVNDGAVIDYPIHTLIDVNCVEAPAPPVGGIGLEVDLDALPLDSPHSSTGSWLSQAALATMAFAVIVLGGVAWFARNRWLRS